MHIRRPLVLVTSRPFLQNPRLLPLAHTLLYKSATATATVIAKMKQARVSTFVHNVRTLTRFSNTLPDHFRLSSRVLVSQVCSTCRQLWLSLAAASSLWQASTAHALQTLSSTLEVGSRASLSHHASHAARMLRVAALLTASASAASRTDKRQWRC